MTHPFFGLPKLGRRSSRLDSGLIASTPYVRPTLNTIKPELALCPQYIPGRNETVIITLHDKRVNKINITDEAGIDLFILDHSSTLGNVCQTFHDPSGLPLFVLEKHKMRVHNNWTVKLPGGSSKSTDILTATVSHTTVHAWQKMRATVKFKNAALQGEDAELEMVPEGYSSLNSLLIKQDARILAQLTLVVQDRRPVYAKPANETMKAVLEMRVVAGFDLALASAIACISEASIDTIAGAAPADSQAKGAPPDAV